MQSKLNQNPSSHFFHQDPTSVICIIMLLKPTNKQKVKNLILFGEGLIIAQYSKEIFKFICSLHRKGCTTFCSWATNPHKLDTKYLFVLVVSLVTINLLQVFSNNHNKISICNQRPNTKLGFCKQNFLKTVNLYPSTLSLLSLLPYKVLHTCGIVQVLPMTTNF